MTDTATIKSFLVSLGFKIDGGSEAKFTSAIDGATKGVMAMGAAMAAATVAVAAATAKMAVDFDNLYFASQRTGASVATIKAFGYAVSQLGGTADGASGSLESLARKMREAPLIREQINAMTGAGLGPDGKISIEQIEKIGAAFRKMPTYMRENMAGAWGIDEKTMLAMVAGVDKYTAEYAKKMKASGLDPEKAAADGNKFMLAWRSIWATLGNIVDKTLSKILGSSGDGLIAFGAWFDAHSSEIASALSDVAQGFLSAFDGWRDGLGTLDWRTIGHDVGEVAKAFGFLVLELSKLVILLASHPILAGMLGGAFLGSRAGPYGAIAGALAGGAAGAYLSDPSGVDGGLAAAGAGAGGIGGAIRRAWHGRPGWMGGKGGELPPEVGDPVGSLAKDRERFAKELKDNPGLKDELFKHAVGENNDPVANLAIMETAANRASLRRTAMGSQLAYFQGYRNYSAREAEMMEKNLAKMLGGSNASKGSTDNSSGGLAEREEASGAFVKRTKANGETFWIPGNREPNWRGLYPDWARRRGLDPDTGLAATPATPAAATPATHTAGPAGETKTPNGVTAPPSGDLGKDFGPGGRWSKPNPNNPALNWKLPSAAAPGQQSFNHSTNSSAALHAQTTINITGSSNPAETGAHVERAQSRLNANLIRNLQGAVS